MFWQIENYQFSITVEHSWASTSRKRPIQSINIFPVNSLHLELLVNEHLSWTTATTWELFVTAWDYTPYPQLEIACNEFFSKK